MQNFIRVLSIAAVLPFLAGPASAEECLKVASSSLNNEGLRTISEGVKTAFKQAGICANYIHMPVKRIQAQMAEGEIDAEFLRVKPYINAMSAHVTHVPTPIVSGAGHIVTLASSGFKPKGVQDVGDKTIGVIHGYKWHAVVAQNLKKTKKAKKYPNLIRQLKAGRIDGFLTADALVDQFVNAGLVAKGELHMSDPVVDISLYLVLHKKNAALVNKLDGAVKNIKSAGGFNISQ